MRDRHTEIDQNEPVACESHEKKTHEQVRSKLELVFFFAKVAAIFCWLIALSIGYLFVCLVRPKDKDLWPRFVRLLSRASLRILSIRVTLINQEGFQLNQPCVYVANHQSALDVLTFGLNYPGQTVTIGKKEMAYIPIFGQVYWLCGNILIDRQKKDRAYRSLEKAVEAIRGKGLNVGFFPEGTRNRTGRGMLPFKKGAFYVAIMAQVPIVPLVSSPLSRVASWKHRKLKGGEVVIHVLPAVETRGMQLDQAPALADEIRSKMLKVYEGYPE